MRYEAPVVTYLLVINVLLLVFPSFQNLDPDWLSVNFGLHNPYSSYFRPYQFLTHFFLHAGWSHLFSNMLGLFCFGRMLEHFWGSKRFLIFYLACGFGASLIYTGVNLWEMSGLATDIELYRQAPGPDAFVRFFNKHASGYLGQLNQFANGFQDSPKDPMFIKASIDYVNQVYQQQLNVPMIGASGAVFGVLMAFGMLFPNTEIFLLIPPIPVKAKWLVALYGIQALFSAVHKAPGDHVAHFAHLGGMIVAFFLVKYWNNRRDYFY